MIISDYRKITVKIGSNVLTKDDGTLNVARIAHLVDQMAALHEQGVEIILVSSGAVAAGKQEIKIRKKMDPVSERQLCSAIGQVKLINRYTDFFREHHLLCAQILTTKDNFSDREHYLNMKNCISTLLENKVIPIVNENDAISVTELMFTDNDELSGLIASMQNSDALILLSNIDGLYDGNPENRNSKVIRDIEPSDRKWQKHISTQKSGFGRGGMLTKSAIARKVAKEGIPVYIANGLHDNILTQLMEQDNNVTRTLFKPDQHKSSTIKKWIAYSSSFAKGELTVNRGAEEALFSPKSTSLLPVGVTQVKGTFRKGDIIKIKNETHQLIGWGKAQYGSEKVTRELESNHQRPIVHYDYLYLIDN